MSNRSTDSNSDPHIGLDQEARQKTVELLSAILGNQHVLYLKTRNYHWNLKGPRFHSLHEFFEKLYQDLEGLIDKTAERIRMVGGVAPGSMKEFIDLATLKEAKGDLIDGKHATTALRADHETVVRELREAVEALEESGDAGTEDFVIALLQAHEETAWMLRSYES